MEYDGTYYRVLPGAGPLYGDVNFDGTIDIDDAELILQAIVGLITLTAEQQIAADVSGENRITAFDASLILQYIEGKISEFPIEAGETR